MLALLRATCPALAFSGYIELFSNPSGRRRVQVLSENGAQADGLVGAHGTKPYRVRLADAHEADLLASTRAHAKLANLKGVLAIDAGERVGRTDWPTLLTIVAPIHLLRTAVHWTQRAAGQLGLDRVIVDLLEIAAGETWDGAEPPRTRGVEPCHLPPAVLDLALTKHEAKGINRLNPPHRHA